MEKDTLFLIVNGGASAPRGILAAEALRDAAERLGRKLEIEVRANGATLIAFDTPPGPDDRILLIGGKAGEKDSSVPERAETIPVVDIGSILTNPTGALELLSGGAVTPGAPAGGTKKELIVAITSCPTGIAHTFMAAEGLEQAAKALGYDIRVETQGSVGAGTPLTPEEISRAALVLIAADKEVERSRFVGKRVFATATKPAITAGEALIRQAFSEATVQAGDTQKASSEAAASQTSQKRAGPYKHLMTGVSFMLPFVVAGGLLIALGFAFGGIYAKDHVGTFAHALFTIGATGAFTLIVPVLAGYIAYSIADRPGIAPGMVGGVLAANLNAGFLGGIVAGFIAGYVTDLLNRAIRLPKNLAGLKPVLILPLLGTLITGLLMQYAVGAPVARALQALTDWLQGMQGASSVLLGLLLGGMMAIDMGGPINKASYAFATGLITSEIYGPMAAAMAGGMTPPLALALACRLFKNRFTPEELEAGNAAAVLGLAFVTEGAIPFAARDPLRVIPALAVGSALAGAISMLVGAELKVPHGGVFVLTIPGAATHLLGYLTALVLGTIVSTLLLAVLKKPLKEV
ncbi:fructose-specific PTS transporter subunit EIIC [uncultured Fretibacterium sp.]|uniref:PTS fructose transporter subunit IIC n=1 Tax=uncultured Fretibacterium sp. TaxID=1678694 RepID=UPI0026212799|nr:fructose-specific PTS transporter subunit EIIC [uncultured Fretibacterium sp.]